MDCTKRAYASFREAQEVINFAKKGHIHKNGKRINRVGKKDKMPSRSYKCPHCGMFHITSEKTTDFKKK